jgi:hypothetical protein
MKDIELGMYMSTYDFVERNKLQTEAEELFGSNWEAEDDVEQIQKLIDYIGGKHIYSKFIPNLKSDEDIKVYFDDNMATIDELKKEVEKYKKGFNEVMEYFDSISDEEKPGLLERLKEIGL